MKHLKPRDILEFLLFGLAFVALILLAGWLESAPIGQIAWIAVVLAFALWVAYIIMVARQRNQESKKAVLWMVIDGHWVAQDGSGRKVPMKRNNNLFDQDEAAIQHLDYDPKEKRA